MFRNFDFAALDLPGYKEDAVREDIIVPILQRLGYSATGQNRMERSKPLTHPFVSFGSKQHSVSIIPDYLLYSAAKPLLVIDAKAPTEKIYKSKHVEQAYSYAIHPEVRCDHFALCNGREFALYHVGNSFVVHSFECRLANEKWKEIESYLSPISLQKPFLRQFKPDFGMAIGKLGYAVGDVVHLPGAHIELMAKLNDGGYTLFTPIRVGSQECLANLDFEQWVFEAIVNSIPVRQGEQIRTAISRQPFSINCDSKLAIHCTAEICNPVEGRDEVFQPLMIKNISMVDYHLGASGSERDPQEILAGVPLLSP